MRDDHRTLIYSLCGICEIHHCSLSPTRVSSKAADDIFLCRETFDLWPLDLLYMYILFTVTYITSLILIKQRVPNIFSWLREFERASKRLYPL